MEEIGTIVFGGSPGQKSLMHADQKNSLKKKKKELIVVWTRKMFSGFSAFKEPCSDNPV